MDDSYYTAHINNFDRCSSLYRITYQTEDQTALNKT